MTTNTHKPLSHCIRIATTVFIAAALAIMIMTALFLATPGDTQRRNSTTDPANRPVIGSEYEGRIRAVFQVTKDEWKEDVGTGLLYLKRLRSYYTEQGIESEKFDIRAVFHGDASTHLLTDEAWNRVMSTKSGNPNTGLITELVESGVYIELCDSRRRSEGWAKSDIHPDVLLAEHAYARLVDLQLQGYVYIRF